MRDRNKTELTHVVTDAAHFYLDARGCKPLEREVSMSKKWVADLAGVLCATETELIALRLLPYKPNWKASAERHRIWQEKHDAALHLQCRMLCLVEVKTSVSDFMREWNLGGKWRRPIPAHLAYIAMPAGMKHVSQLPTGWGALEYYESSGAMRCSLVPEYRQVSAEQQCTCLHEIGTRCDHRVRYAAVRQFRKEELVEHNGHKSLMRFRDAMRAMRDIVEGNSDSVEEVLRFHRINLPDCDIERLRPLWSIKPRAMAVAGD